MEDFRWSACRPLRLCPAAQYSPSTGFRQPLFDACDQNRVDMAFLLFSRSLTAKVDTASFPGTKRYAMLEVRTRDGDVADAVPVEIDEDGAFEADPDIPDGVYDFVLIIGGALPAVQKNVEFGDGSVRDLSFFDIFFGDLDGDGEVSLFDFGILVRNFGRIVE